MSDPVRDKHASITINDQKIASQGAGSILDALERHQIQIESQCRDGYCGACRCQLIEGSISYVKETMAYLNEGEFLACSAVPDSDIVIKTA